MPLATALLAVSVSLAAPGAVRHGACSGLPAKAPERMAEIRARLGVDPAGLEDVSRPRWAYGRRAEEVEGWRVRDDGGRWPVDQATWDVQSERISKYVLFANASTRKAGEAILPMGTVSPLGDGFRSFFLADRDLELEGIERYRVSGKESVYYELRYSPQPREVPFLTPLVKLLIDASTGRLYRYELAADYLDAPDGIPANIVGGTSASTLAALFLGQGEPRRRLGGAVTGEVWASDLYYVRPNNWLGAEAVPGGIARLSWLVPFNIEGREGRNLLFIDAVTGKVIGGIPSRN